MRLCIEVRLYLSCACIEVNENVTLISNQPKQRLLATTKVSFVFICCMYVIVVFLFLVLPVYRKRRVHRTVNLLTGVADANPADLVVSWDF